MDFYISDKDFEQVKMALQVEYAEWEKMLSFYKSLEEHDKQIKDNLIKKIKTALRDKIIQMEDNTHCYPQSAIHWQDVVAILGQIRDKEKGNI